MRERSIKYFYVELRPTNPREEEPQNISLLRNVFEHVSQIKTVANKKMAVGELSKKKCHLYSAQSIDKPIPHWRILFLSGKTNDRRPVVNFDTGEERPNPKKEPEGEKEKNHLVISFDTHENKGIILYEINRDGINIQ